MQVKEWNISQVDSHIVQRLVKDLNISELIKETEEEIKTPMDQVFTDINHTVNYDPPKKTVKVTSDKQESNKNGTS